MGLVRNLKKTLTNLAEKILVELSYLYIKHLAKQTTKKQDNSSQTTSSPNLLTTELQSTIIVTSSQDTLERTTMKMETEDIVSHVREWAIGAIDSKGELDEIYDQLAIIDEFHEWLALKDDELEIMSIDEISEEEYNNYIDGVERS